MQTAENKQKATWKPLCCITPRRHIIFSLVGDRSAWEAVDCPPSSITNLFVY